MEKVLAGPEDLECVYRREHRTSESHVKYTEGETGEIKSIFS